MDEPLWEKEAGQAEWLVHRLVSRLKRHALWNSLLIVFPPLLAFSYIAFFLYHASWATAETLIFAGAALVGLAVTIVIGRSLSRAPSSAFAARLIDDRAEGQDRFLTLATIDPSFFSPFLLGRLRDEAAALLDRVHLRRDFPYRLRRSFFMSCIGALSMILLFHLVSVLPSLSRPASPAEELALMSKRLAQMPRLSRLAESVAELAAQIQKQALSTEENRLLIQELLRKIEDQLKVERPAKTSGEELLSQTAEILRGLEQGLEKGQGQGGGASQSREGEDKGEQKGQGSGGERGRSPTTEREGFMGKTPLPREAKGTDPGGSGLGQGRVEELGKNKTETERAEQGMAKGEGSSKGGREQAPQGPKPERFLRPGEGGEKALKGGRFVTVELPEAEIQNLAGPGRSGKAGKFTPRVPVGNLPLLQPELPDASPEKQPLPLEYRSLIR
jgi:hypothetical protein